MTDLDRTAILAEVDSILRRPDFSHQDKARCDSLIALADSLGPARAELRRAKLAANELSIGVRSPENAGFAEVEAEFSKYLRGTEPELLSEIGRASIVGFRSDTPKSVQGLAVETPDIHRRRALGQDVQIEARAQGIGSGSAGAYVAPASFTQTLFSSLRAYDQLFDIATPLLTKTGSALTPAIVDDTRVSAAVVSENTISTYADVLIPAGASFGACPQWRTGAVLASIELADDSFFDLSTVLARLFGKRFARGCGAAFVASLLTSATSAFTSAGPTALTADEVINLFASVDPAYSINGSWLMNPLTFAAISQIKSSTGGQFMFPAQVDGQGRPLLLGKVVYLSPSMPSLTANNKAVAFGDLSQFYRREVENSLVVKVYRERYISNLQYGYEGFWRLDGLLVLPPAAGSPLTQISPVRYITQHA